MNRLLRDNGIFLSSTALLGALIGGVYVFQNAGTVVSAGDTATATTPTQSAQSVTASSAPTQAVPVASPAASTPAASSPAPAPSIQRVYDEGERGRNDDE